MIPVAAIGLVPVINVSILFQMLLLSLGRHLDTCGYFVAGLPAVMASDLGLAPELQLGV